MHDDLFEGDGRGEGFRERSDRPADVPGPMADREVPLAPVATSDVVHRWLDGELPEPSATRPDAARAVEFWHRIADETSRRRRMVTPAYLPERIMAALPSLDATPAAMPWWKQDLRVSPGSVLVILAGAFALGMLAMKLLSSR